MDYPGSNLMQPSLALLAGLAKQAGCLRSRDVALCHENASCLTFDAAGDQVDCEPCGAAVGVSCCLSQALVLHDGHGAVYQEPGDDRIVFSEVASGPEVHGYSRE